MCFSNLPVEFDDEGNPYLADDAESVDHPEGVHGEGCDCGAEAEAELTADPEGAYEAIVASLPSEAREQVAGRDVSERDETEGSSASQPDRDTAEGD